MSKTLNAFLAGAAVGYWFGTRPRAQAVSEVKHAAESARHAAEGAVHVAEEAYGFAKEKISEVRESHGDDTWHEAPVEPAAPWPAADPTGRDRYAHN